MSERPTKIRLYLDEDSTNNSLLRALRSRSVDVTSAIEEGKAAQSDENQLEWAFRNQRTIYSFNARDFYRIHSH